MCASCNAGVSVAAPVPKDAEVADDGLLTPLDSEAEDVLEESDGSDLSDNGWERGGIVCLANGKIFSKRDLDAMEDEEARALTAVGADSLARVRLVGRAPSWCGHCQSESCLGRTLFCKSRRSGQCS